MEDTILEVKKLKKSYDMGDVKVEALRGIDFDIYQGEFLVVLGGSGSGKSTFMNLIGGIDKPTEGEISYCQKPINFKSESDLVAYRRKVVGIVFQFYNLISGLSVKENVRMASELAEKPLDIKMIIEKVGLLDKINNYPSQLSGGQQQRVAIARALSKNPEMILCDEPTGALDTKTGMEVLKMLQEFNREYGKTVVLITHNQDIGKIATRVVTIKDGLIEKVEANQAPCLVEEVCW